MRNIKHSNPEILLVLHQFQNRYNCLLCCGALRVHREQRRPQEGEWNFGANPWHCSSESSTFLVDKSSASLLWYLSHSSAIPPVVINAILMVWRSLVRILASCWQTFSSSHSLPLCFFITSVSTSPFISWSTGSIWISLHTIFGISASKSRSPICLWIMKPPRLQTMAWCTSEKSPQAQVDECRLFANHIWDKLRLWILFYLK